MDTLIAVLTVSMRKRGLKTILENPEIDSKGLSMQIIYLQVNYTAFIAQSYLRLYARICVVKK